MEHTRVGKPLSGECKAASPRGLALLATTPECLPPKAKHSVPKDPEAIEISRHCVVVEVALHDRPEPLAGLGHGIMHALAKLLLDFLQLLPHPLADRRAPHREVPFPVLPANSEFALNLRQQSVRRPPSRCPSQKEPPTSYVQGSRRSDQEDFSYGAICHTTPLPRVPPAEAVP